MGLLWTARQGAGRQTCLGGFGRLRRHARRAPCAPRAAWLDRLLHTAYRVAVSSVAAIDGRITSPERHLLVRRRRGLRPDRVLAAGVLLPHFKRRWEELDDQTNHRPAILLERGWIVPQPHHHTRGRVGRFSVRHAEPEPRSRSGRRLWHFQAADWLVRTAFGRPRR